MKGLRICILFVFLLAPSMPGANGDILLPEPLTSDQFRPFDPAKAELGRLLFYDKLLSGNRNISCGTCHNHDFASSDGLSLGIGEGGIGLGPERAVPDGPAHPNARVRRNAQALFNLGHVSITEMFHDGRVSNEDSYGVGFNTPAEEWLPPGLQSVVAAQVVFPLISEVEMAGEKEENDVAAALNDRIDRGWPFITARVASVPEYAQMFTSAFADVQRPGDITIAHIANAIDDFTNSEWRSMNSPFDRYLAGDEGALDDLQQKGMRLFYGDAQCSTCHSGPLLTDHVFRALAVPPFGPGRARRFDPYVRDVGRMSETDNLDDAYRFRTPSLRNVAATGPWGHNGAFASLEAVLRHHSDPFTSFDTWDRTQAVMPDDEIFAKIDFAVLEDRFEMQRYRARLDIRPLDLSESEIEALVAFLGALSDEAAIAGRLGKPALVPSGLPVD